MNKKIIGLTLLSIVYILASLIGIGLFILLKENLSVLVNVLVCDVIATIFVWACGLLLKTASTYDPYWSVQTIVIYVALLFYYHNWNWFTVIPVISVGLYSIRLTTNFAIGFHDLTYVDWRYRMLKEKTGIFYQLVNLFGICMFPTLVVYGASVPLIIYASLNDFSFLDIIGSIIVIGGTILELIADKQMKKFIRTRISKEEVINVGLWNYSRHPNYLGEISIWFGVALILIVNNPSYWYCIIGAIINLLMFLFISIPMEENHMKEYKPSMKDYIKSTSCLLILPKRD
jgi:steroid 5-alpha reductase family enzyme